MTSRPPLIIVAHRILIGAAILFGIFFTGWQAVRFRQTGQLEHLVLAIVSALITVAMGYYLKNLRRFIG
jgi:ABC-type Co2+ transport system permease subunit